MNEINSENSFTDNSQQIQTKEVTEEFKEKLGGGSSTSRYAASSRGISSNRKLILKDEVFNPVEFDVNASRSFVGLKGATDSFRQEREFSNLD